LVQLFLTATCVAAGIWTMMRGYRWMPWLILVAFYAASMLVLPRLPSPITHPITTRWVLTLVASLLRFIGVLTVLGCALARPLFVSVFVQPSSPLAAASYAPLVGTLGLGLF